MTEENHVEQNNSFTSPMLMGGIHGSEGYTYQDRYITCHIPKWLNDPSFDRFMPEATGDVDVVYHENGNDHYEHIQVKNYVLSNGDFREALNTFSVVNSGVKFYRKFILSCPDFNKETKSLINKINRFRNVASFYDAKNKGATATTEAELKKAFEKLKIESYYDLVLEKVFFESSAINFGDDLVCEKLFGGYLTEHPSYTKLLGAVHSRVYGNLLRKVISQRGKPLLAREIQAEIDLVIAGISVPSEDTVLHVHNWTSEMFEPKATSVVDWTSYFDRDKRLVPDAEVWETKLIPELRELRKNLASSTSNRNIIFRGKCCLSTGIALGAIFPEAGSWTFDVLQPPQLQPWKSTATKIAEYSLRHEIVEPAEIGLISGKGEIALLFDLSGKALPQVLHYLQSSSTPVEKIVIIQPEQGASSLSIQNDSEAVSLATASKDVLKNMLLQYQANKTHLFYYGPLALGIFLGQKLTSIGHVQLYEFQDPGYKPSCLIKT